MKRISAYIIIAALAAALLGCAETGANPVREEAVIITPTPLAEQAATGAPSLTVPVTGLPEPPLTLTAGVDKADLEGELIKLQAVYTIGGQEIALDITVDGDTMAVGDIYSLGSKSIITVTVAEWAPGPAGFNGLAKSISVDNQPAMD